jgi:hypothetical protein
MAFEVPHQQLVKQQLALAGTRLSGSLRRQDSLSPDQMRGVLGTFRVSIEHNIIQWKAVAYRSALRPESQEALRQSMVAEEIQNRPLLLRQFTKSCGVHMSIADYETSAEEVSMIWGLFRSRDSVSSVACITALQDLSAVVAPHLAAIGKKLGATDFTYTDTLFNDDPKHAAALAEGLIEEMLRRHQTDAVAELTSGIGRAETFLATILTPNPIQQNPKT